MGFRSLRKYVKPPVVEVIKKKKKKRRIYRRRKEDTYTRDNTAVSSIQAPNIENNLVLQSEGNLPLAYVELDNSEIVLIPERSYNFKDLLHQFKTLEMSLRTPISINSTLNVKIDKNTLPTYGNNNLNQNIINKKTIILNTADNSSETRNRSSFIKDRDFNYDNLLNRWKSSN